MEENYEMKFGNHRAKRMMVWLAVVSITMFFAAFTSAYIMLQADHFWVKAALPQMFTYSTILLVLSSVTLFLAKRSINKGNTAGLKQWLVATLILGTGFTATQYLGWTKLQSEGKFFLGHLSDLKGEYGEDYIIMGKGEPLLYDNGNFYKSGDISYSEPINERVEKTFNVSASLLYVLSGFHVLHLIGGLIWLLVLVSKTFSGRITQENTLPLELGSIYWHFLDILWVYLFFFLLFIR